MLCNLQRSLDNLQEDLQNMSLKESAKIPQPQPVKPQPSQPSQPQQPVQVPQQLAKPQPPQPSQPSQPSQSSQPSKPLQQPTEQSKVMLRRFVDLQRMSQNYSNS